MAKIKTRFCPSPTGLMHLGNTRTALFNALLAQKESSTFLLRIEDTDKVRSERSYADILMEDMRWLDLNWHEGPFWQSERQAIYDKHYAKLVDEGFAYPCFCSEEQLALNRKIQRASGKPPRYAGTCCSLNEDEVNAKIKQGLKTTLRFRVPKNHEIVFHDLVRGEQHFNSDDIGDFIIRRTDGTSPFMFCNAIDDALMGVTHALRGEDHLTNTPRQIMILRALDLPEPKYGHISLIMGADGAPLSKRNGSRSLHELREEGFLPLALLNYLARLGHHYGDDSFMSLAELAAQFNIKSLGHAPARFDFNQLSYWQKHEVLQLSQEEFLAWMGNDARKLIPVAKLTKFINAIQANTVFPAAIKHWAEILFTKLIYNDEQQAILKDAGPLFFTTALAALKQHGTDFKAFANNLMQALSIKGKALYMPLRIVLTGERHGPELAQIFELLGADTIKLRLEQAITVLHS